MATPKKKDSSRSDFYTYIKEQREKLDRDSPILATRWFVTEVTPPSEDDYGSWVTGSVEVVSSYYETKAEAQKFIEDHDPTSGTKFGIEKENLREYRYKKWGV